ncbi:uncharacterized protein LOC106879066 isoform X1 [Octopus bimaculoides]|uniref:uncharacterized protein LOC106879066 isoform X1 n=1 Tax=Octopus bimaculoides TaxID=37653 RepID=UPI0022DFD3FF|nr:uncharacterized protein LOC106879066 isoform X1 [Octopus bimaculoides]
MNDILLTLEECKAKSTSVRFELVTSYPSLNLRINVNRQRNHVDVVLPGLRYDDLDNAGLPDVWRIYDMISRVEFASFFHHESSFLDYKFLLENNITTIIKAVRMDIRSGFFETTTPKAPLGISLKLSHINDNSLMTTCGMICGGKMKPSIIVKNVHAVVKADTAKSCNLPDWWLVKHKKNLTDPVKPYLIKPQEVPAETHNHVFTVPLTDVDALSRTRCSSYVRYFAENASIASLKDFYPQISTKFHNYCISRMSMLYFGPTTWGDVLVSKTWEDATNPYTLHCNISKDSLLQWYGCFEFHPEIFGLEDNAENIS